MQVITFEREAYKELISKIENLSKQKKDIKTPIYNTKDLCALFKVSSRTLQSWRDEGKISFSQINGTILYSQKDIDEFLSMHHNKAFKK